MLYPPTVLMAKLSLLLLYLKIFHSSDKLRYCVYFSMGSLSLFYCGAFISYAVLTIPRIGLAEGLVTRAPLGDIQYLFVNTALNIVQGVVGVASDFVIFCLPIPVVWKLQLPWSKKIGVLAIFMTGLL